MTRTGAVYRWEFLESSARHARGHRRRARRGDDRQRQGDAAPGGCCRATGSSMNFRSTSRRRSPRANWSRSSMTGSRPLDGFYLYYPGRKA
ncbi:hypothetical protein ACTMU2_00010 [Cupriavidus basilensis]